jgi:predicted dehydrogenase
VTLESSQNFNGRLKIALLGAGLIGQKHAALVAASSECELTAICDPNPHAAKTAEQYGALYYTDVERLLAERELDGAIVATPTNLHAPLGMMCAERGVHMLVEKPITTTLDEARELVETAKRCGAQVLVGHHRRHNALIQKAREIVRGGEIGKLVGVNVLWALLKPEDYFDVTWRKEPGGGPILINLIHEIDSLRFVCGEIERVYAASRSMVRGFEVEDTAAITIEFENGAVGTILVSDATPAPWSYEMTSGENPVYPNYSQDCYHFMGTRSSLAFPSMTLWNYASQDKAGWHHPLEVNHLDAQSSDALSAQLAHFCRVIRGEEAPIVSGEDGWRTLAATLAVIESGRRGVPIRPVEI